MVILYTLEIKVSEVVPNTSIKKLVLVLPVASFVIVMMKASSEAASHPLSQQVKGTV
jgi:hypothetical protein